nr:hypothetical protein [Tanacetum cinerariifolium]
LENPPSKHLVFEEPKLDKHELGKLEVGKPRVDKQALRVEANLGMRIKALAKLILKLISLKIWLWSTNQSNYRIGNRLRDLDYGSFSLDHRRLDVFGTSAVRRSYRVLCRLWFIFHHLRKKSRWRLENPPSKDLVFEEPELDKHELGKLEVGKPRVDKQVVD